MKSIEAPIGWNLVGISDVTSTTQTTPSIAIPLCDKERILTMHAGEKWSSIANANLTAVFGEEQSAVRKYNVHWSIDLW